MTSDSFTNEDFLFLKEKIFEFAGIHLTEKKKELVKSRVLSFLRKSNIQTTKQLRDELVVNNPMVVQQFVNLLTTNKTDFFREPKHFDFLIQKIIPFWEKNNKKEVNVWCSASSTGEEPYTIAMVLARHLPKATSYKILATDIDTQVLSKAKNGVYPTSKLAEIPSEYHSYLILGQKKALGWFKASDEIHSRISFHQHNLVDKTYPGDGMFDIIFCRNVLIYFERKTINNLMKKLHLSLKFDGHFFIGHSESIAGNQHLFESVQPSVFRKVSE